MIRSNVREVILRMGHDDNYEPVGGDDFLPTGHPPGSYEKIEVLRQRVDEGKPLWHEDDCEDYRLIKSTIVPVGERARRTGPYTPRQTSFRASRKSMEE